MKYLLLLFVLLVPLCEASRAAAPFLKPNDVIALVGGEDMVAASEYGYLELLLQRALPSYRLKVRSLAWEGDTVFEQPRDLNYPTLEQQLDDLGATVVIMQFGQMESLAGTSKLPEFIKAYEKVIERVSAGGKRRVVLMTPTPLEGTNPHLPASFHDNNSLAEYCRAIELAADKTKSKVASVFNPVGKRGLPVTRDGLHLTDAGSREVVWLVSSELHPAVEECSRVLGTGLERKDNVELQQALADIRAKNRYWYHYTRPQNWAFLNGDRTEQPSSRDHKDPSKRWFPEEMKQWLPLIDAKEKEIWALAAKAAVK